MSKNKLLTKVIASTVIVLFIGLSIFPSIGNISKASSINKSNNPPYVPSNPIPPNGSTNVSPSCLEWTGGDPDGDVVVYNVYFGKTCPPPLVCCNISQTLYCHPGLWEFNTTYYWKIVAWDEHGASTEGPIWSFTTRDNNPPNTPIIDGPRRFKEGKGGEYTYTFYSTDPEDDDVCYLINWSDGIEEWLGPFKSGEELSIDVPIPNKKGTYVILKIRAEDIFEAESDWAILTVNVTEIKVKPTFLLGFIENVEQEGNFSFVTAKRLLTARLIPFDVRVLSSGEEIVISNEYIGYVGSRFIIGRFKADLD